MSTGKTSLPSLTAEDLNGLNKCIFDWCDAIDHKDWERLAANVASTLTIDYRQLGLYYKPNITAREYLATINAPHFLGNPTVKTQHLVGAGFFTLTAPDEAEGKHQVRAAHQIYSDESLTEVKLKGHGMSSVVTWHKKMNGVWKLAGLRPDSMWTEHDFAGVMAMASPPKSD